jgi:hypothetical protein
LFKERWARLDWVVSLFGTLGAVLVYGWFHWLSGYILISPTSCQLSLFLSPTSAPAAGYHIQPIATSTSVFSLPVSITISDLTISEFIS